MQGHGAISEVLQEWKGIGNRVAKSEGEEKVIVCGRQQDRWYSECDGETASQEASDLQVYPLDVNMLKHIISHSSKYVILVHK